MGNGPGKLSSNKMINIFPRASEMREWAACPRFFSNPTLGTNFGYFYRKQKEYKTKG